MRVQFMGSITRIKLQDFNEFDIGGIIISNVPRNIDKFFGAGYNLFNFGALQRKELQKDEGVYGYLINNDIVKPAGFTYDNYMFFLTQQANSKLAVFLDCLWLIKDNSVSITTMLSHDIDSNYNSSNSRQDINSTSRGTPEVITFTKNQFMQSLRMYEMIVPIFAGSIKVDEIQSQLNKSTSFFETHVSFDKKMSRIHKCCLYIANARRTSILAEKISFYIVALESLFTTGSDRVKYQVSIRTSFFSSRSEKEVFSTFKSVSAAYKIRSQYLHGLSVELKAKENYIADVSSEVDSITRKTIVKVLNDFQEKFNLPSSDRKAWFDSFVNFDLEFINGRVQKAFFK